MILRLLDGRGAYLLLAFYFLVNVAIRVMLPQSLEMDEGQQLFLAQWLAAGYDSQPPLYNWLQYGLVALLGETVFSLALLKNAVLFGSYALLGLAASRMIEDRKLAAIAMLGLITIPQISFEAQRDLSHTVAVLFSACLFVFAFVGTLKTPSIGGYILTGISIGLGMLSKYNFALLPISAVLAVAVDRDLRARLLDARILLVFVFAAVIFVPHGLWFLHHVGVATERTLGKLTVDSDPDLLSRIMEGFESLFLSVVAFFLPTLAIFVVAFWRDLATASKASSPWTRLIGRMMVLIGVMLILLVFAGASAIKPRWLIPFFFLLPLYLGLKLDAAGIHLQKGSRRFAGIILLVMLIIPSVLIARPYFHFFTGEYEKLNVPYGPALATILGGEANRPSLIVTSDLQMAGDIRLHAPGIPVMVPGYEEFQQAFAFDAANPVLVIWRDEGESVPEMPVELKVWLSGHTAAMQAPVIKDIARPYHFGRINDLYHFDYAWIYPVK